MVALLPGVAFFMCEMYNNILFVALKWYRQQFVYLPFLFSNNFWFLLRKCLPQGPRPSKSSRFLHMPLCLSSSSRSFHVPPGSSTSLYALLRLSSSCRFLNVPQSPPPPSLSSRSFHVRPGSSTSFYVPLRPSTVKEHESRVVLTPRDRPRTREDTAMEMRERGGNFRKKTHWESGQKKEGVKWKREEGKRKCEGS